MMWLEHPTDADLEKFMKGRSTRSRDSWNSRVVRHLLADCSSCKERMQAPLLPEEKYEYSSAFAAAEQGISDFFAMGKAPEVAPEFLLCELQRLPEEEQVRLISSDRFATHSMVELLIERSHEKRFKSTQEMIHLAQLSMLAASACTIESSGSQRRLSDLRARAWCNYGNSLRVSGRLPEAEEAFAAAKGHLQEGTGDPPLRARFLDYMSSLRMSQGRNLEAIEISDEAAEIYRELDQMHAVASAFVKKAIACLYAGEPEDALAVLNRAIPLIDPEKNPHLLLAACHNLIVAYCALERPEEALSLYFEVRDLYREFDDALILLRTGWQEGQLLRDLGHLQAAEAAMLEARKGFLDRELPLEAALVSLDLACLYVKMGKVEDLKQTVTAAVPIFRTLGVEREALAALLQLQHATDQEQQALEIIRRLNSRLAPLRHSKQ